MAATLDAFLKSCTISDPRQRTAVIETVHCLTEAALQVSKTIHAGPLAAEHRARRGSHGEGDDQKGLDIHADDLFLEACRRAPVAVYATEERSEAVLLDPEAPLAIAVDPVDGSSNIDTNISIGTIFSMLPAPGSPGFAPAAPFFQRGRNQLAAGYFIYGPQLALVITFGHGTFIFVHSARYGTFVEMEGLSPLPPKTREFAINMSNYHHWDDGIRLYVDDCLRGEDGPREKSFNMRWLASMVAECQRILMRGGVYLYPGDNRKGYRQGRLRLVYEANPIAMIVEQAGGTAPKRGDTTLAEPSLIADRAPLFGNRSLLRA